jgi:hypothetical protein
MQSFVDSSHHNGLDGKVDMLVIDDREETIEEEIEDSHETNNQQRGQGSPKTPLDAKGKRMSKTREDLNASPYLDEPI